MLMSLDIIQRSR